jgi:hypothetical protein
MGADRQLIARYERLAELAERELAAVLDGATEQLEPIRHERDAIVAALPAAPPPEARAALEEALGRQAHVTAALSETLQDAGQRLGRLRRGRAQVRGYAGPAAGVVDASG